MYTCTCILLFVQKTKEAAAYLAQQNREVYRLRGILVTDPMLRGLEFNHTAKYR